MNFVGVRRAGIVLVLVAVVAAILAGVAAFDRATDSVGLTFSEPMPAGAQVFVARDGSFSERNSLVLPEIRAGERFELTVPGGYITTIRIDPPVGHVMSLCDLRLEEGGRNRIGDYGIAGSHELARLEERAGCVVATPALGAGDPQVVLHLQRGPPPARAIAAFWWLAVSIAAVAGVVWMLWRRRRMSRDHRPAAPRKVVVGRLVLVYVAMSLVFGTLYALVTPPGAVADEYAHVTKAVKVGHGVLVGATGDREFPDIIGMYGGFNGYLDPAVHFAPMQLLNQIKAPVPCTPTTAALPHGADAYPPHLYAIPAAAYALSCSLNQDLGFFLLVARLGNLVLATLLIAIGIWVTVRARWVLVVCALLPMSIYQIASVSADSTTFALCFAWIGVVCGVAEGRLPVARAGWLLVPLAIALSVSKPGAAWVLAAILFARPAFIAQVGTFVPALLKYLVLPFIVHVAWVLYASGSAAPLDGVDPAHNLAHIFHEPVAVALLYANTFFGPHGAWLVKGAVGALGWLDVGLSSTAYVLAIFCLVASAFMGQPEKRPPALVGLTGIAIAAGAAAALAAPLFIFWTLPGSQIISGLQGRYFIPCIAFALAFVAGPMGSGDTARKAHLVLTVAVPIFLGYALVDGLGALVERYYP